MRYDSRMRRVIACCFVLSIAACGASASSVTGSETVRGERFPIVLHRSAVVGQRGHVTSETSHREQTTTTFQGQVVDTADATSSFALDAIAEVLRVDAAGDPEEVRYDVRSFVRRQGAVDVELIHAGQVLVVTRAETREGARVQLDAAPVSEELVHALEEVIPVTRGGPDDDALFGSATPRAAGEHWPADVVALVRGLTERSPLRLDPGHVRGEAGVQDRSVIEGVDGLNVVVAIAADHVQVAGLASGASVRDGRVSFQIEGFFPMDTSIPRLRQSIELQADLSMTMATPQGNADVALHMTMTAVRSVQPL
jgi:hypothetical protein